MPHLTDYSMTTEELAGKLGYNVQYVRFLASKKKLPAIKRGRAWKFCEAEVMDFLKNETEKNTNGDVKHGRRATDGEGSDLLR